MRELFSLYGHLIKDLHRFFNGYMNDSAFVEVDFSTVRELKLLLRRSQLLTDDLLPTRDAATLSSSLSRAVLWWSQLRYVQPPAEAEAEHSCSVTTNWPNGNGAFD